MNRLMTWLFIVCLAWPLLGQAPDEIHPKLAFLSPFLGKTYIGDLTMGAQAEKKTDIACWERILNGQGIRIVHSVNQGEYGGETIIFVDPKRQIPVFYYFTTAGFMTTGTIWEDQGALVSEEDVQGNPNGITKVRATSTLQEDGTILGISEYLKEGTWVQGHQVRYRVTTEQQPIFR
jgi:hypothetical protein